MKYFTEPNGIFVIKIPVEWQYKNIATGIKETSPFSFELYENSCGAFQISCYPESEKTIDPNFKVQKSNSQNLEFVKVRTVDNGFNIDYWYAVVENHIFMAKYIYSTSRQNTKKIKAELEKVEKALSTLELISVDKREIALELDKYEKFIASLCASFDLKNKALENKSPIELLVIIANQIDAYLRIAIVLKKQLKEKTDRIDIKLLYQGESDVPIMERKIYKQALELKIITLAVFSKLELLYSERNKVIHRYIISEFKTRNLYQIVYEYEVVCEKVRLSLKKIEDLQFLKKMGMHGGDRDPNDDPKEEHVNLLYSQINDKHLIKKIYRKIEY
jgi:hypothetical protein